MCESESETQKQVNVCINENDLNYKNSSDNELDFQYLEVFNNKVKVGSDLNDKQKLELKQLLEKLPKLLSFNDEIVGRIKSNEYKINLKPYAMPLHSSPSRVSFEQTSRYPKDHKLVDYTNIKLSEVMEFESELNAVYLLGDNNLQSMHENGSNEKSVAHTFHLYDSNSKLKNDNLTVSYLQMHVNNLKHIIIKQLKDSVKQSTTYSTILMISKIQILRIFWEFISLKMASYASYLLDLMVFII